MILSSVIIILREALEAAVLISLLLVLGERENVSKIWLGISLFIGAVCAGLYARFIGPLSNIFDGAGQEIINASLHILIVIMLLAMIYIWFSGKNLKWLFYPMILSISAAVIREGSEIVIFYSGLAGNEERMNGAVFGGAVGLLLGMSVGALLYYWMSFQSERTFAKLCSGMLSLVAAGMVLQAINLLVQVDYIGYTAVFWNTSDIVSETSLLGQLLYAIVGYEAEPSWLQVLAYISTVLLFSVVAWLSRRSAQTSNSDFSPVSVK